MVAVTSATGGILAPTGGVLTTESGPDIETEGGTPLVADGSPAIVALYDLLLDTWLQAWVAQIVNLQGSLIRPRWQPIPPTQPANGIDWGAVGTISIDRLGFPALWMDQNGNYWLKQDESLEVLVSFYGVNCGAYSAALRDGAMIQQNCEYLLTQGAALTEVESMRAMPELVNEQWQRREDTLIRLRRAVLRSYQVETLVGATITVQDDTGHVNITINVNAETGGEMLTTESGIPITTEGGSPIITE